MAIFEKLRVSLARDDQGPLLERSEHPETYRSRYEFLRDAFAEERTFLHSRNGRRFDFIPLEIDGDYAAGIFRKAAPMPLHDEALERYEAKNYEWSVFLISLSKDQIAWMQHNKKLGSPKPIIESFFSYLIKRTEINDWRVFIKHIEDEAEYFSIIKNRRSEIAEISFTFIPPNALNADSEVYNFVKTIQGEAHPDTQRHVYRAEPGQMYPDTEHMNASARVAMAGGGEAEVKDGKRRILYGKGKGKITREVPNDDLPTPKNAPFIRRVRSWLFSDED